MMYNALLFTRIFVSANVAGEERGHFAPSITCANRLCRNTMSFRQRNISPFGDANAYSTMR